MFVYYSREYRAASIGLRIVDVTCEKCGTGYCFELARVGTGAVSAPYGIGTGSAAQKSKDKAKDEVDRRLADEAELVPCPQCYWVNESLVSGYRLAKYRRWASFGRGLAILGSVISLVATWFLWNGPAADRDKLVYFFVVGPLLSIGLGVVIFLTRNWLRNRIRPNENFPHPPRLPRGCPTPLMKNPATGKLEAVGLSFHEGESTDQWVDFQLGRSGIPLVCSGCLAPSEPKFASQRPLLPGLQLIVPSCRACSRNRKRRRAEIVVLLLGLTTALTYGILMVLSLSSEGFWVFFVGLSCILGIVGIGIGERITTPFRVKFVDHSRGILRIWFRNEEYRKLARVAAAHRP